MSLLKLDLVDDLLSFDQLPNLSSSNLVFNRFYKRGGKTLVVRCTFPVQDKSWNKREGHSADAATRVVHDGIAHYIEYLSSFERQTNLFRQDIVTADGSDLTIQVVMDVLV